MKDNGTINKNPSTYSGETVEKSRRSFQSHTSRFGGVLVIVFGFMLLLLLLNLLKGNAEIPTFQSLLTKLGEAPNFATGELFRQIGIPHLTNGWIFDFLNPVINVIIDLLNVLEFIFVSLGNVITYLVWFLGWIFGF